MIDPRTPRKSPPERVNALLAMRKAAEKTDRERSIKANAARLRDAHRPKD